MRTIACTLAALTLVPAAVAASSTRADAWTTHRSAAGGFTVSTPATWIDMTRLSPEVLARVRALPALAQYVTLLRSSKIVKLLVADASTTAIANHYASNLNVVQAATIGDLRLQHDATIAQLRSSGVVRGTLHASYVTLPAGRAVSLSYLADFGGSTPTVALQQFMFVRGGKATVLTYTTLPKLRGAYETIFARSARSFRFV